MFRVLLSGFASKIEIVDSELYHTSSYNQSGIAEDFLKLTLSSLLTQNTTFSDIRTDADTIFIKAVVASSVTLQNTTFNRVAITNSFDDSTAEFYGLVVTDDSRTFLDA